MAIEKLAKHRIHLNHHITDKMLSVPRASKPVGWVSIQETPLYSGKSLLNQRNRSTIVFNSVTTPKKPKLRTLPCLQSPSCAIFTKEEIAAVTRSKVSTEEDPVAKSTSRLEQLRREHHIIRQATPKEERGNHSLAEISPRESEGAESNDSLVSPRDDIDYEPHVVVPKRKKTKVVIEPEIDPERKLENEVWAYTRENQDEPEQSSHEVHGQFREGEIQMTETRGQARIKRMIRNVTVAEDRIEPSKLPIEKSLCAQRMVEYFRHNATPLPTFLADAE